MRKIVEVDVAPLLTMLRMSMARAVCADKTRAEPIEHVMPILGSSPSRTSPKLRSRRLTHSHPHTPTVQEVLVPAAQDAMGAT